MTFLTVIVDIELPKCATDEFVSKIIDVPVKYKGSIIGHIEKAVRSEDKPDHAIAKAIIYDGIYDGKFYITKALDDEMCFCIEWLEFERGEMLPTEVYFKSKRDGEVA